MFIITEQQNEPENVWAQTVEGNEIFIGDAISGRKGYFCLGCQKEMQAVKSEIQGRKQFFRHDPKFYLPGEKKCTYSDETYRHKLAKEILQRIKKIKVPTLYKFPPPRIKGQARFLAEAKFIEAYSVRIQLSFYEDENGKVCWGREGLVNRNLIIVPDVAFFNAEGEPILLIEIVATHKISEDKYLKIKRLGIDTVSITIPKDSSENIEKAFLVSTYTQWIYNYEQESTTYVPIAESNAEGISPADELPNRIFNETISCREFQIRELIRRIKICLEASEYRSVEQRVRSELSRVEELAGNLEKQRRTLQRNIRDGIQEKYRARREAIEREKKEIERDEEEFERSFRARVEEQVGISESDLLGKIGELETEEKEADERLLQKKDSFQSQIGSDRIQITTINQEQKSTTIEINRIETCIRNFPGETERIQGQIENLPGLEKEFRKFIAEKTSVVLQIEWELSEERTGELRKEIDGRIAGIREEIEGKYRGEERRINEAIKGRDFGGNEEFARLGQKYFDALRLFENWSILANEKRRVSKGKDCIVFGTYKNWHD